MPDPIAANLLRQWAKRPWDDVLRFALADRIEELGLSSPVDLRSLQGDHMLCVWHRHISSIRHGRLSGSIRVSRRWTCKMIAQWKSLLEEHFPDFLREPHFEVHTIKFPF